MSFADTFGFAPELPNQWRVPGKRLIVAIEPRFARRLEHASASASPRSGGLLFGQVHSGDPERVILTDCVPLQWDRSQGGAPFLTAIQREQMEAALAHESSNGGGPQIVGWYRSASPDEGALSQDDMALWEQYFRRSSDIAILAGYHSSSFRALVFVNPAAEVPDLDLPLHRFQGVAPTTMPVVSQSRLWLRAAVGFLAIALLALASHRWAPETTAAVDDLISAQPDLLVSATAMPSSPLDLSATPSGNTLRIVWNVATPALSDAVCGSLSLADSRDERTVRLSSIELRRGYYSYSATSGVVDVRMDIFTGDGRLLTGTLRYIDGSKLAPYAPAAARFAVPLDSAETGENAETSKYNLCANPPAPAPGRTPRWIAAAKPLHSPTFNLPARLPLEEKTIVIAEEVLLDEEGLVVDVKTPNPGRYGNFAAELAQQLRQWKFKPATQDRVPVATTVKLEFSLRSRI